MPLSSQELWSLSAEDFNEWRRANDLPFLLEFFKNELPNFCDWMNEQGVTDEAFVKALHTGEWFLGKHVRQFLNYFEKEKPRFVISEQFDPHYSSFASQENAKTLLFKPYLAWGAEKHGRKDFIPIDRGKSNNSDSVIFQMWRENGISEAYLLREVRVLKLGQYELRDPINIGGRNLDFADLDFLTISGERHGGYGTVINFSSCRNLSLVNAGLHHVTFTNCFVENFRCIDSRMQDFVFKNSEIDRPEIRNSTINGLSFEDSRVAAPIIERTEIQRFTYKPRSKSRDYSGEADVCRRFRTAFQNIGKNAEASQYYFREQCLERKALWSPYLQFEHLSEFPKRKYNGRLRQLFKFWKEGHFDNWKSFDLFLDILFFHVKVWLIPRYIRRALTYKIQYFVSFFWSFLWGYGERPLRVIRFALLIIGLSSLYFYFYGPTGGRVVDSIYFSVITFTTLGYGDISPTDDYAKIICSLEALLGGLSIGLLIGGVANRSRY